MAETKYGFCTKCNETFSYLQYADGDTDIDRGEFLVHGQCMGVGYATKAQAQTAMELEITDALEDEQPTDETPNVQNRSADNGDSSEVARAEYAVGDMVTIDDSVTFDEEGKQVTGVIARLVGEGGYDVEYKKHGVKFAAFVMTNEITHATSEQPSVVQMADDVASVPMSANMKAYLESVTGETVENVRVTDANPFATMHAAQPPPANAHEAVVANISIEPRGLAHMPSGTKYADMVYEEIVVEQNARIEALEAENEKLRAALEEMKLWIRKADVNVQPIRLVIEPMIDKALAKDTTTD